jgi:hypothetical protein
MRRGYHMGVGCWCVMGVDFDKRRGDGLCNRQRNEFDNVDKRAQLGLLQRVKNTQEK